MVLYRKLIHPKMKPKTAVTCERSAEEWPGRTALRVGGPNLGVAFATTGYVKERHGRGRKQAHGDSRTVMYQCFRYRSLDSLATLPVPCCYTDVLDHIDALDGLTCGVVTDISLSFQAGLPAATLANRDMHGCSQLRRLCSAVARSGLEDAGNRTIFWDT